MHAGFGVFDHPGFSMQSDAISEISSETLVFVLMFPGKRKNNTWCPFTVKGIRERLNSKVHA